MEKSPDVRQQVSECVNKVYSGASFSDAERTAVQELFERYECWEPLVKLLESSRHIENALVELIRVHNIFLEDTPAAVRHCQELVAQKKMPYRTFRQTVLPRICEPDDFEKQAQILRALASVYQGAEKIENLTDLSVLYDKKLFNSQLLHDTYSEMLDIDPCNIKALRYFKHFYSQNEQWSEVARVLKILLEAVRKEEKERIAYELAGVHIYREGNFAESVRLLDQFATQGGLDAFNLLYDAYTGLKDWNSCIRLLLDFCERDADSAVRSIAHFRVGENYLRLRNYDGARKAFEAAIESDPTLWEAYELLITAHLERKDWSGAAVVLEQMRLHLTKSESKDRVSALLKRLG